MRAAVISPVADTQIRPAAEFQSSALKTHGAVLDAADRGVVRIKRRDTPFILIREDRMRAFIDAALDTGPQCLADLLRDVTHEAAADMRASVAGWTADPPGGKEKL